jgi:tRNA nucleotidyltransferase (CCA-adding enzyme)
MKQIKDWRAGNIQDQMSVKKCGIIFYRPAMDRYLLVLGKKSEKWGFPKGHQENNETEEETAVRELFEETGIHIRHEDLLSKIRFKNNIYFNVSTEPGQSLGIQDTNEIVGISWLSIPEMMLIPKEKMNFGLKNWLSSVHDCPGKNPRFVRYPVAI